MDPVWLSLVSGATGAAVTGYLVRLIVERAVRTVDDLKAENKRQAADMALMDRKIEAYQANLDKRLELGNQRFEHTKHAVDDLLRRTRDLEIDTRANAPTRIMTVPKD